MTYILMSSVVAKYDAVGNDVEAMYHILNESGKCVVFAIEGKNKTLEYIDEKTVKILLSEPDNIAIYHHSVYWKQGYELLSGAKCKIVFRYHNVTPSSFFAPYNEAYYNACELGRKQTDVLQMEFPEACWMAASEFNTRDLYRVDPQKISVVAPFHKIEEWGKREPDGDVVTKLRNFDGINLLFVGRVVPNKGHLLMIETLRRYCSLYDNKVKLRIIGNEDPQLSLYSQIVRSRIEEYGLTDNIEFVGSINDEKLVAYYRESDFLLCCSAHEGFCVPIIEAQYFQLPIIALRYCAVPETIGDDQLLLGYDPSEFAAAIHILSNHHDYRDAISSSGLGNYHKRFGYQVLKNRFLNELSLIGNYQVKTIEHNSIETIEIVINDIRYDKTLDNGVNIFEYAKGIQEKGYQVEIITSTSNNNSQSYNNYSYPVGVEYIGEIAIVRIECMYNTSINSVVNNEYLSLFMYIRNHYNPNALYVFVTPTDDARRYAKYECGGMSYCVDCSQDFDVLMNKLGNGIETDKRCDIDISYLINSLKEIRTNERDEYIIDL